MRTLNSKYKPPSKTVNVCVVGIGFMGVTHIKSYQRIQGARLAAICDAVQLPKDGDLSRIAGNLGGHEVIKLDMRRIKGYRDLDDALADPDIDLIDLCVPTPLHHPLAIAALKAGKHVICEKPLARTARLAREIVEVAAKARGFFMPAMCLRFWPEWVWVKNAIDQKTYGRVLAARFRRVSEPPGWSRDTYLNGAQSGGALLDLHIHDSDFVQFCFGRPSNVFSSGATRYSGAIDHVVTQYQVRSGVPVSSEGSWLMTPGLGFNMAYTVNFKRATADYDLARGQDALCLHELGKRGRTIKCKGDDGYVGELRHMIESIQAGKAPTVVTPQDGLSAVEICEAEEKSVKLGQVVALP